MTLLGLDLGGSHATCSLVRGKTLVATRHLPFADTSSFAAVEPEIRSCLSELAHAAKEEVAGLGIGMCGIADSQRNEVLSTNGKYDDTVGFDFDAWAQKCFGVPARVENDARLALRGEMAAGAAEHCGDVVMFTLGTGIGGVAAMGGAPLIGVHGQAGLLGGHVPVRENGRRCTCGGLGCAEAEASGWALPEICHQWPGFASSALAEMPVNFKSIFVASDAGDAVATAVRNHCLNVWAMMTVAAIHSFDPELVIFGGGVMNSADQVLPFLQAYVDRNTWTPWGRVKIVAARLGDHAAALGVPSLFAQGER